MHRYVGSTNCGRILAAVALCLSVTVPLLGQEITKHDVRYKIEFNLIRFPQKKPQEALASVVKAVSEKKYGYLLAQLVLPAEVDVRVLRVAEALPKGSLEDKKLVAFEKVEAETAEYFARDPATLNDLRRFAADGSWEEKDGTAVGTHKDLPGRKLIMHKLEGRWFMENRSR